MKRQQIRIVESELDALLHPSQVYEHPSDVVNDPDLSLKEKRAVLASWASDACAVEAAPALRKVPSGRVVQFDEIMDALRLLDQQTSNVPTPPTAASRRTKLGSGGAGHGDQGMPVH
jgi:hypothetical protein